MTWRMKNYQNIFLANIVRNTIIILPVITVTFPVGSSLVEQEAQQLKEIMDYAWVWVIMTGSRYSFMSWVIEDSSSILRNLWDILMIR